MRCRSSDHETHTSCGVRQEDRLSCIETVNVYVCVCVCGWVDVKECIRYTVSLSLCTARYKVMIYGCNKADLTIMVKAHF